MRIAVVFKSLSGNTAFLARAVREMLKEENIVYFGEPQEGIEAEVYFIGSWTDKGTCAVEIATFMQGLREKKIAYFGTAGFGGSDAYYQSIYSRVKENADSSNQWIGCFFCQGRMPAGVRKRYEQGLLEHPDDRRLMESLENFDRALAHPDENDRENVKKWAKGIAGQLE